MDVPLFQRALLSFWGNCLFSTGTTLPPLFHTRTHGDEEDLVEENDRQRTGNEIVLINKYFLLCEKSENIAVTPIAGRYSLPSTTSYCLLP
jgi:hypothetical protein